MGSTETKAQEKQEEHKPVCPLPPPDLPPKFKQHILEEMGGTGLVLVIQKIIFYSDVTLLPVVSPYPSPKSRLMTSSTRQRLKSWLGSQKPMQVCLLDPSLKQTSITFNKWVMGNTSLYVLTNT
ncbi:hypothetical protein PVK06_028753 [Gossypium arboreum]|uniref:Uncharacterized protein n=1 Tax=Gossypium arboreum TaxID=29729 RepID=A0ABR0P4R5_GOSAR|nr:hypothetical protein PVK06_028753 [Gossypium arboreum]